MEPDGSRAVDWVNRQVTNSVSAARVDAKADTLTAIECQKTTKFLPFSCDIHKKISRTGSSDAKHIKVSTGTARCD